MGLFKPNIKKLENRGDIKGLAKAVNNKNPAIKKEALKALERNPDDKAIVPLFNYWYTEKTNETKEQLKNSLLNITKKTGAKPLIKLFETYDDKNDRKFSALFNMLTKIGDADSIEPLFVYTSSIREGIDAWSLTMMVWKIGGEIADTIMQEILNGTRKGGSIDQAARYFAKKREKSVVPDLINLLKSVENEHTKQAIAYSLGEICDDRAVEPLINALSDKRKRVADTVVGALGNLNDARAIEPLMELIKDEKSPLSVRQIYGPSALRRLSKLKKPEDTISRVKRILLKLPIIKEDNIAESRQRMINQSKPIHPSMFVGSTAETIDFITQMMKETETYILSCEGISSVEKAFLISNLPIKTDVLEIQYEQFWNDGTSVIYSEHAMRIGEDKYEIFGSEKSAKRMADFIKK